MSERVDNLLESWVELGVKNVLKHVHISSLTKKLKQYLWGTPTFTQSFTGLFTDFIHSNNASSTSATGMVIPTIHSAYNNQLKGNFIRTSNRRSIS